MRKAGEGESMRGILFSLSPRGEGGVWGPPTIKFLNFERFYVRFNRFWSRSFARLHLDFGCATSLDEFPCP